MNRVLQKLNQSLNELPWRVVGSSASVGCRIFGSRHANPLGILTYHRVVDLVPGVADPEHNVTPKRLRHQLEGMLARGYEFWPLDRLLTAVRKGTELHDRIAVVTFDDGYESVYLNAFPVLKELKIPATVFVATSYLDGKEPFFFDDWGTDFHGQLDQSYYGPLTSPWGVPTVTHEGESIGLMKVAVTDQPCHDQPGQLQLRNQSCFLSTGDYWIRVSMLLYRNRLVTPEAAFFDQPTSC